MTDCYYVILRCVIWFVPKKEMVTAVAVAVSNLWFISYLQVPVALGLGVEVGMMEFLKMMEMF